MLASDNTVARGGNGHPWLVLSSNLDRFRAALSQS
jgi:hypothetical protein